MRPTNKNRLRSLFLPSEIMKVTQVISIGALTAGALAQSNANTFEKADFNITEALIGNGVDVSAIPELSGLVERTLDLSPCAIAVIFSEHAETTLNH